MRSLLAVAALLTAAATPLAPEAAAQTGSVTVFPSPGSKFAHPGTQISFRGVTAATIGAVSVSGARSGARRLTLRDHSDGKGVSALLDRRLRRGERVVVRTGLRVRGGRRGDFRFRVSLTGNSIRGGVRKGPGRPRFVRKFRSRPDLRPPRARVTIRRRGHGGGKVFVTPKIGPGQNGSLILDNRGDVVWFRPVRRGLESNMLEVHQLGGRPVLAWWEGFSNYGVGVGVGRIADTSYREIATVRAGNGYDGLDPHEFRITPRGTALVAIETLVYRNLRAIGGARRAQVFDAIVQEIDIPTGLVLYEWHSLDHVSVRESYRKPPRRNGNLFDYFHINSIDEVRGGHFVVSGRNTWGVYKIDRYSGRVRWRLGGKRSSFRMRRGTRFAYQHDARVQRSGLITIFDNQASPPVGRQSRGIALRISRRHGARLVRSFRHKPGPVLSSSQGSMQRLPGGNLMLGWGSNPIWTEVTPRGRVLYRARLPRGSMTYRAYRFPWSARPEAPPDVAADTDGRTTRVYASWNGATGVATWTVLAGASPTSLRPLSAHRRTGFETAVRVPGAQPWVAVQAVGADGKVLGTSKAVRPG